MLDERIEVVRKQYNLRQDDFWKLPQGRDVWLVKHAALEVVAAKAGITFDMPEILEAKSGEGVAAICVRGFYNDRAIWSIGEASPKNCKNAYPWAIAEKRAIDRVILKLIGLHGLVYSEEEGDDFKEPTRQEPPRKANGKPEQGWREDGTRTSFALKKEQPDLMPDLVREADECKTLISLEKLKDAYRKKAVSESWNGSFKEAAKEIFLRRESEIMDEMERLAVASPDELTDVPLRDALEHSLSQHPLNAG